MENSKKRRAKKGKSPFGKNLQALISERQLSQRAVAEIAGVSVSTINDWLAGGAVHDLQAVSQLCTALGADFEFMLTGNRGDFSVKQLRLEDIFDVEKEENLSGIFWLEAKRLSRK